MIFSTQNLVNFMLRILVKHSNKIHTHHVDDLAMLSLLKCCGYTIFLYDYIFNKETSGKLAIQL